ncbi:MAG: hypothetical protein CMB92_04705 [Flammeovirgaceae bacterium]|nr:hypothetical protein [Flammeovirgaceae bacterium]|tara:strand:+ start:725 stop:1192 length:468 start_codon:yes stop_codon:yes gene_type:complete
MKVNLISCLILFFIISSCNQNKIIHKFLDFDDNGWNSEFSCTYRFSTEDIDHNANISLSIRYDIEYPYQNFYYSYHILDSIDTIAKKELNEMILFDEKNGKPIGNGISKTFILEEKIIENLFLKRNSSFSIHIYQMMREENLLGIKSVGVLVEKN